MGCIRFFLYIYIWLEHITGTDVGYRENIEWHVKAREQCIPPCITFEMRVSGVSYVFLVSSPPSSPIALKS